MGDVLWARLSAALNQKLLYNTNIKENIKTVLARLD